MPACICSCKLKIYLPQLGLQSANSLVQLPVKREKPEAGLHTFGMLTRGRMHFGDFVRNARARNSRTFIGYLQAIWRLQPADVLRQDLTFTRVVTTPSLFLLVGASVESLHSVPTHACMRGL